MFDSCGAVAAEAPDPGVLAAIAEVMPPSAGAVSMLAGFDPARLDPAQRRPSVAPPAR